MAWNEPGSSKQRDPWRDNSGNNKGSGGGGRKPPDMDDLVKRIRAFFNRLTGGGGGGFGMAIIGLLIAWVALDSWARIDASQSGVVLRFGQFSRLMPPGINLKWPRPFESVVKVNAKQISSVSDQVRMLTQDENIVQVDFNVQYQIGDPEKFLFGVRGPDETLAQAAESAVRTVIGANSMDTILSGQRTELIVTAKKLLQATLDKYGTGLVITELNFQNVRPPQEVKDAFDDANRALQDKQRLEELAKADASQLVPEARGDAARIRAESEGYKSEKTERAVGDADRFNLIEAQYRAAPEVTRKRLYLETMQQVVSSMPKVIDSTSGKNILYVPVAGDGKVPPAAAAAAVAADASKGDQ